MNLDEYQYNGFKLYSRTFVQSSVYGFKPETIELKVLVQYKDGIPFKSWYQREDDEFSENFVIEGTQLQGDVFVQNMTEEEVFTALL